MSAASSSEKTILAGSQGPTSAPSSNQSVGGSAGVLPTIAGMYDWVDTGLESVQSYLESYTSPAPPSEGSIQEIKDRIRDWAEATTLTQKFKDPQGFALDEISAQITRSGLDYFSQAEQSCYINPGFKPANPMSVLPNSNVDFPVLLSVLDSQPLGAVQDMASSLSGRLSAIDGDVKLWTLSRMSCLSHAGFPRAGGLDWEEANTLIEDASKAAKSMASGEEKKGFF